MVSIGPQGHHDHPARDPRALESSWLPSVLALEIPLSWRPTEDRRGTARADRDCVYGAAVTRRLRAMGIRDKPIASGSPWQNGFAERLIGSIRRECVDHVIVLGDAHLRRILTKYAAYYNELRNSSVSWQRRSDPSRHPARRPHRIAVAPGRTSSPLLQNLIFDTDTIRWLIGKGLKADLQARKK